LVRPKVAAYNEPSFASGDVGTLHGKRTDANGYKFLRIHLYGSPEIKVFKGCKATFEYSKLGNKSSFVLNSDTKEIESYYSTSLRKGITEIEFYLTDPDFHYLVQHTFDTVTLDFGKSGFFRREKHTFQLDIDAFQAFFK
jgi:hypothetical protein